MCCGSVVAIQALVHSMVRLLETLHWREQSRASIVTGFGLP